MSSTSLGFFYHDDDDKNDFGNKSCHHMLINIMAPQSDFRAHCPLFVRFSQASRTNFVGCTYKLKLSSSCGIEIICKSAKECDQRQYYLMYVSLLLGPGLVGVVRGIDEDAASKTTDVKRLSDIVPCYIEDGYCC